MRRAIFDLLALLSKNAKNKNAPKRPKRRGQKEFDEAVSRRALCEVLSAVSPLMEPELLSRLLQTTLLPRCWKIMPSAIFDL
jgi:hypothetical protein